jgi:hypothetical protein
MHNNLHLDSVDFFVVLFFGAGFDFLVDDSKGSVVDIDVDLGCVDFGFNGDFPAIDFRAGFDFVADNDDSDDSDDDEVSVAFIGVDFVVFTGDFFDFFDDSVIKFLLKFY